MNDITPPWMQRVTSFDNLLFLDERSVTFYDVLEVTLIMISTMDHTIKLLFHIKNIRNDSIVGRNITQCATLVPWDLKI